MTPPASPTLEPPVEDDVVESLNAAFRLPAFTAPRELGPFADAPVDPPATLNEYLALALFACLALASVALLVVSLVD